MPAKPHVPHRPAPAPLRPTLDALGESTVVVLLVLFACFVFSF